MAMGSLILRGAAGAALLIPILIPAILSEPCPPPQYPTVDVECSYAGSAVTCDAPLQPGTKATFRCKALHNFLFDYLPPAGYESECRDNGQWSIRPFVCAPVCGQPTGRPTALVRNGEKVSSAADYPWHVAIYDIRRDLQQICGGTLVSSKYFVSAAHCFYAKSSLRPVKDFKIAVGKIQRVWDAPEEVNAQKSDLKMIHVKNYGDRKLQYTNDIALVEVKTELAVNAFALPVCIDWALELPTLRDGEEGTVVGYGKDVSSPSKDLRFAKLPFVPLEKCRKNVTDSLAVFTHLPDKFCVGYLRGATVAQGDSGGGLAFPDLERRRWFLRGIVSVGSPTETTFSLFTNVTNFVPWMASIIQKGEVTGRRCGVDVTESHVVDGAPLDKKDFPWEVDVYYKEHSNRNFKRLWSGTLVEPNIVITSALIGGTDLTELPPSWLRVVSRRNTDALSLDLESAAYVGKVRRFHYPEDVLLRTGHIFLFVLLELEAPLKLMPACMDWSGNALLQSQRRSTTIVGTEQNTRHWRRYDIQSPLDCKSKKVPFLDFYNFCIFGEGRLAAGHQLSSSLMVSVDNTWFLRGVVSNITSGENEFTAVYTDVGDSDVQKWLSKTKDVIGKPTCGKVNLCSELHAGQTLPGHLPWNVGVVIQSGNTSTMIGGVVVQSNAVLTDPNRLVDKLQLNQNGSSVPTVPPSNIKVVWTATNGSSYTADVVKMFVHESTVLDDDEIILDAVVLELASEVDVMPVCLDLTGLVLQPLELGQTGVVETWKSWAPSQHKLTAVSYVTQLECIKSIIHSPLETGINNRDKFCSGPIDEKVQIGAGYVINTGTFWYLRGVSAGVVIKRPPYVFGSTDYRNKNLRSWLSKTLKDIETKGARTKEEFPLIECVGGNTIANECGRFSPYTDEDTSANKVTLEHLPWTVDVHVDEGRNGWKVRAGTLVRSDVVLTESFAFVTDRKANITGDVSTIPTSNVIVKWFSADFRDRRITEVLRIHAHERAHGHWKQSAWDVILLELKTPIPLMPACLPRLAFKIPPLSEDQTGLVETWTEAGSGIRPAVKTDFIPFNKCRQLLPNVSDEEFAVDRFCVGPVNHHILWTGAAFVAQFGNAWFLRGLNSFNWGGDNAKRPDLYSFCDVSNEDVMTWLEEKMGGNLPVPTTTSPIKITTTTESPTPLSIVRPLPSIEDAPAKTSTIAPTKTPRTTTTIAPVKCGQLANLNIDEAAGKVMRGRLPWSVAVVVDVESQNSSSLYWRSGTLIRPNVVITDGNELVTTRTWNDTGRVFTIPVRRVNVVWVAENGGRRRSGVESIHVHERGFGERTDFAWDLAILILKNSFSTSPACLDLDGTLPSPNAGDLGMFDTWNGDFYASERYIVLSPFVGIQDCQQMLPNQKPSLFTPDRVCTGRINVSIWDGAGYVMKYEGSWYFRGYKAFYWGKDNSDLYGIVSADEPSLRSWIQEVLGE